MSTEDPGTSAAASAETLHRPVHPIRFVTAASLFDGHDAAINIMRRILQSQGAEVIHLGHNRSVDDVVRAVVDEDVHGVAISSYQGGHMEYFTYLVDRLRQEGRGHVKVYGGGGGVIVAAEIEELHAARRAADLLTRGRPTARARRHGQHDDPRVRHGADPAECRRPGSPAGGRRSRARPHDQRDRSRTGRRHHAAISSEPRPGFPSSESPGPGVRASPR